MARLHLLFVCIVGMYFGLSASTSIECNYRKTDWRFIKHAHNCFINNDPSITTLESATITSISGDQKSGKTSSDVEGIFVSSKTINYFPRGLETYFKNIRLILIGGSKLKEIHQEDLKPFPKLVEIYLQSNLIEVLEEGLLDFNPDLQWIELSYNKIVHIEPKIFDHLNKLEYLFLHRNTCLKTSAERSVSEYKNIINSAESQCINSDFSSLKEKLENLEKDSKTLNSEEFGEKLATFEQTFNASKFANFRPLNYKFEAIKNLTIQN